MQEVNKYLMRVNRFSEVLPETGSPEPVSRNYINSKGKLKWLEDGNNGFDKEYPQKTICLPKGIRILRYGGETGQYAAPINTPYSKLSMPYKIRTCEYNEYEVVEDGTVEVVVVEKGIVAVQPAWPCEEGGGVQYFFPDATKTVAYYVGRGLKRLDVFEWSEVMDEDINHL